MNTLNAWHVKTPDGKVQGPFSDQEIVKMAKAGAISRADQMRHPERTKGAWVNAIGIPALAKLLPPQLGGVFPATATPTIDKSAKNARNFPSLASDLPEWTEASGPLPGSSTGTVDYWAQVSQEFAASKGAPTRESVSSKSAVANDLEKAAASLLKDEEDEKKLRARQKGNNFFKIFAGFALSIGALSILGVFYWFLSENSKYVKESIVPNVEAMVDKEVKKLQLQQSNGTTIPNGEQGTANWNRLVAKAQRNAKKKVERWDNERSRTGPIPFTCVVRGDIRKTNSLTNPYEGELVITDEKKYIEIGQTVLSVYTYKFAMQGDSWVPITGVMERTETKGGYRQPPKKETFGPTDFEFHLNDFLID
jgi:hypothetical protein